MTTPNIQEQYVAPDGRLTIEGYKLFDEIERRLSTAETALTAAEAKLAAIAALSDPTGGATIDAEARTVIAAILDASA